MKQRTRELLLTTKASKHWNQDFDQRVDELMSIISKVDNENNVQHATETMDVYHSNERPAKSSRKRKLLNQDKPFEFLVFRN